MESTKVRHLNKLSPPDIKNSPHHHHQYKLKLLKDSSKHRRKTMENIGYTSGSEIPSIAFIIAKWRPTRGAAADQTGKKLGVGSGSRGEQRWERVRVVMKAQL